MHLDRELIFVTLFSEENIEVYQFYESPRNEIRFVTKLYAWKDSVINLISPEPKYSADFFYLRKYVNDCFLLQICKIYALFRANYAVKSIRTMGSYLSSNVSNPNFQLG